MLYASGANLSELTPFTIPAAASLLIDSTAQARFAMSVKFTLTPVATGGVITTPLGVTKLLALTGALVVCSVSASAVVASATLEPFLLELPDVDVELPPPPPPFDEGLRTVVVSVFSTTSVVSSVTSSGYVTLL